MDVGPAVDENSRAVTASSSRLTQIVGAVSALVLVAAVVLGVVMGLRIREANAAERDRSDAVKAAEQFALRMDGIQLGNFEAYKSSVEPLLTTKEKTVFEQQFKQFEQVYKQAKAQGLPNSKAGKGTIVFAAASDADPDSATVLVAHDSSVPGQAQALHFRWQLGMRKVEGTWLVDDFQPVE